MYDYLEDAEPVLDTTRVSLQKFKAVLTKTEHVWSMPELAWRALSNIFHIVKDRYHNLKELVHVARKVSVLHVYHMLPHEVFILLKISNGLLYA